MNKKKKNWKMNLGKLIIKYFQIENIEQLFTKEIENHWFNYKVND